MVHTLPDYTTQYKLATVFGQIDSGELAARLGSIVTFDRRGNVVWMDDFEGVKLLWDVATDETGYAALNTTRALNGSQSCKMNAGGTATGNNVYIQKVLAYPVKSKIGFEITNTWHAWIEDFIWRIMLYDGTYLHRAEIKWNDTNNKLYYYGDADDWVEFASDVDMLLTTSSFNICKLVVDFVNGKYSRFIFNEATYDLSSYSYYRTLQSLSSRLYTTFEIIGEANRDTVVYVDNAIVTQNEP